MSDVKIFAKTIAPDAQEQIQRMAASPIGEGSRIRIMPDCHAGAGCTIGTTMTITDKICPNLVGVDIACGVMLAYTDIRFEDRLEELDASIRQHVPSGRNVHIQQTTTCQKLPQLVCWDELRLDTKELAYHSTGTLGGGNHFIEAYRNGAICVHTGSRNIGLSVAMYYQNIAAANAKQRSRLDLSKIIPQERQAAFLAWKARQNTTGRDDLAYLEGKDLEHYLHDCSIIHEFAKQNREVILTNIVQAMGGRILNCYDTIHNYIDVDNGILRKGAVSAQAGERLTIPLNMQDGVLICSGKGNADWNYSAPHGAGRLYSRNKAKHTFSLEQYKIAMSGIYSSCINFDTLDEAPFAYKNTQEIMECIEPTVEIIDHLTPIYNFKASD